MNIPESELFVSVSEAAHIIGCSRKKVYRYIKEGRLLSSRVGRILVLRRDEVQQLLPDSPEKEQRKAPPWQSPRSSEELLATIIHVQIQPGKQEELEEQLAIVEAEQQYTFGGSLARYIMGDNESIEIVLIWNRADMPEERTWCQDIRLFQRAFAGILDWNTATISRGHVLHHT